MLAALFLIRMCFPLVLPPEQQHAFTRFILKG